MQWFHFKLLLVAALAVGTAGLTYSASEVCSRPRTSLTTPTSPPDSSAGDTDADCGDKGGKGKGDFSKGKGGDKGKFREKGGVARAASVRASLARRAAEG